MIVVFALIGILAVAFWGAFIAFGMALTEPQDNSGAFLVGMVFAALLVGCCVGIVFIVRRALRDMRQAAPSADELSGIDERMQGPGWLGFLRLGPFRWLAGELIPFGCLGLCLGAGWAWRPGDFILRPSPCSAGCP